MRTCSAAKTCSLISPNILPQRTPACLAGLPRKNWSACWRHSRTLHPAMLWFDSPVNVVSRLDSTYLAPDGVAEPVPVLAVFNARPSQLSARMFTSLGELRETYFIAFVLVLIAFFVIFAAALV